MDRMEGRCPSRDPTKNSLGGDTERGHRAVTPLQGFVFSTEQVGPARAQPCRPRGRTGTPGLELWPLTHRGGWRWPRNAGRMDLHPALQGQQFSDSSDNPVMCQSRNHLSPAPAQPFSPSRGILIPPLKFPNFLLFIKATFSAAPSPEPVSGSGLLTSPGLCLRNSRLRALKGCL